MPSIRKGSTIWNMLYDKWLKNKARLRNAESGEALATSENILATLFEKYGATYSLDWMLLSAGCISGVSAKTGDRESCRRGWPDAGTSLYSC